MVRLLSAWYEQQKIEVKWKEKLSEGYKVNNGVRKDSALSPPLFNISLDDLLVYLRKSEYGGRIGDMYASGTYDDDVTLVSPKRYGIHEKCWIFVPYLLKRVGYCPIVRKLLHTFSVRIDFCHS